MFSLTISEPTLYDNFDVYKNSINPVLKKTQSLISINESLKKENKIKSSKLFKTQAIDKNYKFFSNNKFGNVNTRLKNLSKRFKDRAKCIKEKLDDELSVTTDESEILSVSSVEQDFINNWTIEDSYDDSLQEKKIDFINTRNFFKSFNLKSKTYDFFSFSYLLWQIIVTLVYLYNCWMVTFRTIFPVDKHVLTKVFFFDFFCDIIYFLDIYCFKSRLRFYENGLLVKDFNLIKKNYFKKKEFLLDCLSLLPLDVLFIFFGSKPFFRLPRLLKFNSFENLFNFLDSTAKYPYVFRILKTMIYMMFLVHLNACAYYYMSYLSNFDPNNKWVYNLEGNAYLRCFYFAIRTATSISGRMPKPISSQERVFMTISWLLGVFVFAFLIGQIRDIVANATQNETHYRKVLDQTINYMNNLHLPEFNQNRIKNWLNFTWQQQNTFDESSILNTLPNKSRADISLNLHSNMLKQVELFKCLDRGVICELATKIQPVLFLPGDWIFCKNDIANEMYIVNKGKLKVYDDNERKVLLSTLKEGAVFGEIAILDLPGSSKRRTASVCSIGYSTLYKLQKSDLWETLKYYPEVQTILKKKANQIIRKNIKKTKHSETDSEIFEFIRAESVIENPIKIKNNNKLANIVMHFVKMKKKLGIN